MARELDEYRTVMNLLGFYRKYDIRRKGNILEIYELKRRKYRNPNIDFSVNSKDLQKSLREIVIYVLEQNKEKILNNLEISLTNLEEELSKVINLLGEEMDETYNVKPEDIGIGSVEELRGVVNSAFEEEDEKKEEIPSVVDLEEILKEHRLPKSKVLEARKIDPYLSYAIQTFSIAFSKYIRKNDRKEILKEFVSFKLKEDKEINSVDDLYSYVIDILVDFFSEYIQKKILEFKSSIVV